MTDSIPAHVHQFLRDHVKSIAQLELLILMHGAPEQARTPEATAKQLYIPESFAGQLLENLRAAGVATVDGDPPQYRYAPQAPHLGPLVDDLVRLYRERPVTTVNVIYSAPTENLQTFADAFRIRRKENE